MTALLRTDAFAPASRSTSHRGEAIRVFKGACGGTRYTWRGATWSKGAISIVCDEIDDFKDHPERWTECAGCGHPLCLDDAVYADDDDDATACHSGGCVDEYNTLADAGAWR